jgi:hypothetical protein
MGNKSGGEGDKEKLLTTLLSKPELTEDDVDLIFVSFSDGFSANGLTRVDFRPIGTHLAKKLQSFSGPV